MPVIIKDTNPRQFEIISRRLENPERLLNRVSRELKSYIKKGFETAGRSTGSQWEGHSEVTVRVREAKGTYNVPQPILIETGQLKRMATSTKIIETSATGFHLNPIDPKVMGAQITGVTKKGRKVFRPIYRLTNSFATRLVDISGQFIVSGKVRRLD